MAQAQGTITTGTPPSPKSDYEQRADRMYAAGPTPRPEPDAELSKPDTLGSDDELTPEQRQTVNATRLTMVEAFGLGSNEAFELHNVLARTLAHPPSPHRESRWDAEARSEVARRYGSEAPALLAKAKEIIEQHGLGDVLRSTRLGSHPKFVLAAIEAAKRKR
jgi:hypothetical protein